MNNTTILITLRMLAFCWLLMAGSLFSKAQTGASSYSQTDVSHTPAKDTAAATHLYDTSQNIFTPKTDRNQLYSSSQTLRRKPLDNPASAMKKDNAFWYVTSTERIKAASNKVRYSRAAQDSMLQQQNDKADARQLVDGNDSLHFPQWAGTFVWAIVFAVFLFALLYFLSVKKIGFFVRNHANTADVTANMEAEDLFALPYQQLLQQAYAEKDYRLAIRILYLQTLKLFSEKNILLFRPEYTNSDYLAQLSQTGYYQDFFAVTRHYEYAWYGSFAVSEAAFRIIQARFMLIQNKILHP